MLALAGPAEADTVSPLAVGFGGSPPTAVT